jgi:hypothetical protein
MTTSNGTITQALAACFLFNRNFFDCGFSSGSLTRPKSSLTRDFPLCLRTLILSRRQNPGCEPICASAEPKIGPLPSSSSRETTCGDFESIEASESEEMRRRARAEGELGVLVAIFRHEPIAGEDLARGCWTLRGGASDVDMCSALLFKLEAAMKD